MPKLSYGHRSIAALLVVVGLVSAMPFYAQQAETEEQYINRLIKEATGAQPVQESRFPKQRTIDNAFRTQFRNLIQQNREFFTAINKVDKEKLKKLMTPESFADPQVGGDAVKELDAYATLEQEHGNQAEQTFASMRHTFEVADLPAAERDHILKSFDTTLAEPQTSRRRYLVAAKAWVSAVDDLYHYAAEHKAAFKIEDGTLRVSDDETLTGLNQRIKAANSQREDMLKAMQDYKTMQDQHMKASGIDPKTVGLQ